MLSEALPLKGWLVHRRAEGWSGGLKESLIVGCVEGQHQEQKDKTKGSAFLKRTLGAITCKCLPIHANYLLPGLALWLQKGQQMCPGVLQPGHGA